MSHESLMNQAKRHMKYLCSDIPGRSVGSEGNRLATEYAKKVFRGNGWVVEETKLSVMDWRTDGATLRCDDQFFEVFSSPYSNGCHVKGELIAIDTIEKLKSSELKGKIILLHGEIASEQIMPKNFVFYNPEEHKEIISILDKGNPSALICATGRNAAVAGGVYPFPMFEDGDFDIPSVYMKDVEGEKLHACACKNVELISRAMRIPETAYNIVAREAGKTSDRIVITAHIDAKIGTPGAIDNGTGVTAMLLLSELLKDYEGKYRIEFVAFNGEDYYAVPGQMKYLEQNAGKFGEILLNINIDGMGYREGLTCFSPFELPGFIMNALSAVFKNNQNIVEGLPWVQGDHSIFLQAGRPAIAVSSNWFIENFSNQDITHTPKDNLDIVSYGRIAEAVEGIRELIKRL